MPPPAHRMRPGVLTVMWTNLVNSFKGVERIVIGTDSFGNIYYTEKNNRNVNKRTLRGYVPANKAKWQEMPVEWEAWLRERRKFPPTEEEILRNAAEAVLIAENIQADAKLREEEKKFASDELPDVNPDAKPLDESIKAPFPAYKDLEDVPGSKFPGGKDKEILEEEDFQREKGS